jgi:predicted flavoprotein YhiN
METNKLTKKLTQKPAAKTVQKKTASQTVKKEVIKSPSIKTSEQLVVENLTTLTSLTGSLSETLDVLVKKVENMAYHIIATEEVLSEIVTSTGLDIARVNVRIRSKIASGTDKQGDPTRSIDIAASIASPLPKFENKTH